MKFVEIAAFLFIFNLMVGFVSQLNLTEPLYYKMGGWGHSDVESGREKLEAAIGEQQEGLFANLNWLIENVRLVVQALGSFVKMIAGAVLYSRGIYQSLLCYRGVDCNFGSAMDSFIWILYGATSFVYTAALIQIASGRSFKEGT